MSGIARMRLGQAAGRGLRQANTGGLFPLRVGRLGARVDLAQPPGPPPPEYATGEPWADLTFWSDTTGWLDDAYAEAVLGIEAPVGWWRLGDTATTLLADMSGNGRHGTYPVAPTAFQAVDLTWGESDGASVDFGGVGYGEVADNPAFHLAEMALSFLFRATAAAITGEHGVLGKDGSGSDLLAVKLLDAGGGTGTLRVTFGAATLSSATGAIVADQAHHVVVMADAAEVTLVFDGSAQTPDGAHTDALTNNTAPWSFGRTEAEGNGDVELDEVAVYARALSAGEIDSLRAVAP
ncbi:MAG TPA: LamG-like jellyroll fold domain-containing protein [Phycisphaerae bacterium]|nr:LamG-like jellyroll fold domain-containing protein [Phycisphaerae bacterium]